MDYKLVIFGRDIYREVELDKNSRQRLLIGTTPGCRIRFNREHFFDDFEIFAEQRNGQWILGCNQNVFFKGGDLLKQNLVHLKPGDSMGVCYEKSGSVLFSLDFMYDYERKPLHYDQFVQIQGIGEIRIGNHESCHFKIQDETLSNAWISLKKRGDTWELWRSSQKLGVYKNGYKLPGTAENLLENGDFFSLAGHGFFLFGDKLYLNNTRGLSTSLPLHQERTGTGMLVYPHFQRNSRVEYVISDAPVQVLAPKSLSAPPKKNLVMILIPVIASLILMVALRGLMGSGGMFVIYSVAMMALGGAMSVWTYFNDGKEYKQNKARREEKYQEYIRQQEEKIQTQRAGELAVMDYTYTSLEDGVKFVETFDSRLFERRPKDSDFLTVFLGKGYVRSTLSVKCKEIEYKDVEDPLQDIPVRLKEQYEYLENAPVTLGLKEVSAVGVVGNENKLYQILKNMVLDLAIRHYYGDVKFYFIFSEKHKKQFEWLRWLKNAYNSMTDTRCFIYDEESEKAGLDFLYSELSRRENAEAKNTWDCHYVVFVYQTRLLDTHPLSRYISLAKDLGFTFIFMETCREFLAPQCEAQILLDNASSQGCLVNCSDGKQQQYFTYPHISSIAAGQCALKLGSIYVDEISLEKSLTKNISMFQLLGIINVDDLNLKKRWAASKIYESMAAPLGVKSGNEVVFLDLHEKFHGPHGLVAGTTGSGKSEILQSYILSMATLFHPYEVGFVIIDFKGGGMVNQFRRLPHLNGAITNIDGSEIERSLLSIRAELRKRQELFARYDVNHIDAYIRKYKNNETDIPLPHLILIVDEFAELKSDQPEFMKELISTARIGRSLGVHLILATQKPSGVVDNQIWSNSRFKLCLKVQNKEDSNEVLKSPLAAEIKEPGRAYLQVGNNEIFQLFQSAYSGVPAQSDNTGNQRSFTVSKVELSGKRTAIFSQKPQKAKGGKNQLEAIVDYVHEYCMLNSIKPLPGICLEPLPETILWEGPGDFSDAKNIIVPLGLLDDPEHQKQTQVTVNFTQNHIFVLGSARYGKTNVLQAMIRGLAQLYTPEDVHIYILDFASMALKRFEGLPHVGGVITSMEDEKMKTFMKMMDEEMKRRREILLKTGVGSFNAYRESGHKKLPQVVIMIDNVAAFRELYEKFEDRLLALCREGLSLGISVVAANLQTSGFGYKYLSNFSCRICLYCNDSNEYNYLFDSCRKKLKNIPGRALTELDRKTYEIQVYQSFEGDNDVERAKSMESFVARMASEYAGISARKIPEIPAILTLAYIKRNFQAAVCQPYEIYLGIDFSSTNLEKMSLLNQGTLGIGGAPHMGRGNFIRYMLHSLNQHRDSAPVECYIIDDVDKKLGEMQSLPIVKAYTVDASEYKMMLGYFDHLMEERYQWMVDGQEERMEKAPLLVWLLRNNDVISSMSGDREMMKLYRQLCTKYRALKICIIYGNLENAAINYSAPEVLKMLRDSKNFLIFTDIGEQKLCDVPFSVSKEYTKPLEAGEAYRFSGIGITKIKTVLEDREEDEQD